MNKPKLLDQVRLAIRRKHYSHRTEQVYVSWIRSYIRFHQLRHPKDMGEAEVTAFLNHLANDRKVSASTRNQALAALLFLYKEVLKTPLAWLENVDRAQRPKRLPVVLTRAEVTSLLQHMDGVYRIMANLLYSAGLRLLECVKLRVKDIDFGYKQIVVRSGKGDKDRITLLPEAVIIPLQRHLANVKTTSDCVAKMCQGEIQSYVEDR